MNGESFVQRAVAKQGRRGNPTDIYAWFFMRLSGVLLLVMAVFHLMYMHFVSPGGAAGIDYDVIIMRWTDPTWGDSWRTFDLLLLLLSVMHSTNGIRYIIDDYVRQDAWRVATKVLLYLTSLILLATGTIIIFSVQTVG